MSTVYETMQKRLARGWNTWNTRSVLSHVLLPEGFALNLGVREYVRNRQLKEALIGRRNPEDEQIRAGLRTYDGRYSELKLEWSGNEMVIQSATSGEDLLLLITPLKKHPKAVRPPLLIVEGGILWNRPGYVTFEKGVLIGHFEGREIPVFTTQESFHDPHVWSQGPYLSLLLDGPIGISTGQQREITEIQRIMEDRRQEQLKHFERYGECTEVYRALQTALAWNTIYDPENQRVISPVSRIWNVKWGGYVLFEWDTYFAAYMAAIENKEMAYANAVEITRAITEWGMVPNFTSANGIASRDRSQPPVGSLMCRELYRKYADRWFLEEVFPLLLRWNRWWDENRNLEGLLCWGSNPYSPTTGFVFEHQSVNAWQAGAYESGLDNSPVFDDVPFDPDRHLLLLHDAGLNGLYVADCEALADIAAVLNRPSEERELRERGRRYQSALSNLWDERCGIYLNRRTDTGEFVPRISPPSFYPLIARAATQAQAERMIADHFNNPRKFWGDWMIPSIARDDPAYADQDYWRGRIWGSMNFLVYLGLRNYNLAQASRDLATKSKNLLLKEWRAKGHVHENYHADTGEGCDRANSDAFYHWGGMLGVMALIEAGIMPPPETPLLPIS